MAKRRREATRLTFKTCWTAPGYRDLGLVAVDAAGNEYELHLPPKDVQRLIFECADVTKQINDHPPLDWDQYRSQIFWPTVRPWMKGPAAAPQPAASPDRSVLPQSQAEP